MAKKAKKTKKAPAKKARARKAPAKETARVMSVQGRRRVVQ